MRPAGYTKKNYQAFQVWVEDHGSDLLILAMPSDEFGGQERAEAEAIKDFVGQYWFIRRKPSLIKDADGREQV